MTPQKKLARNAPCPCGSEKEYGDCCYEKGFEYLLDEDGTVFQSVPLPDQLAEVIKEQNRKFIEQYGRELEVKPPLQGRPKTSEIAYARSSSVSARAQHRSQAS